MRRGAFTFIELLVVIAIIAVLAAISVPNFLEAQVRSKVARVKADLATLVAAIEDYHLDHHAYPPNLPWMDRVLDSSRLPTERENLGGSTRDTAAGRPFAYSGYSFLQSWDALAGFDVPALLETGASPLRALYEPTQYVAEVLPDPFSVFRNVTYLYVNWEGHYPGGLPLEADGPCVPFVLLSVGPDTYLDTAYPTNLAFLPYDPTNGITSNGDIHVYPR
ncbi:prepilin-type N-terminal cleavage/methylation domain-containing protein [Candidatus Sumerlaeota bacterium]|nr:prepilin-type N-terminal cleavage/methylation domain-containing protein [Candidatus Sumerlaeota bacterium]